MELMQSVFSSYPGFLPEFLNGFGGGGENLPILLGVHEICFTISFVGQVDCR